MSAIAIPDEPLIPISKAVRHLPRRPSPPTLWRWHARGIKIRGRLIRLQCWRVGGKWLTTQTAWATFLGEMTAAGQAQPDDPTPRTADAERRLRKAKLI
jgi:hypothetical protein